MEDHVVIMFADGTVTGHRPGITPLSQGFSFIASGQEAQDCIADCMVRDYGKVNTGHGSYLVTATLQCLGLGVRQGGSVALLRVNDRGQASLIFHQASDDSQVPAEVSDTAVVPSWHGSGWTEPIHVRDDPDDSPRTDWPINTALRKLGVERGNHPDEITAVGLVLPTASGT